MRITVLIILVGLLVACGGNSNTEATTAEGFSPSEMAEQAKAFEGMMGAHDRVMPKMSQIAQLQKAIMTKLETEKVDAETATTLKETYSLLEKSYDGMMEWMKSVKSLDDLRANLSHADIQAFIAKKNGQMEEVESLLAKGLVLAQEQLGDAMPSDKAHDGHDHGDHEGYNH